MKTFLPSVVALLGTAVLFAAVPVKKAAKPATAAKATTRPSVTVGTGKAFLTARRAQTVQIGNTLVVRVNPAQWRQITNRYPANTNDVVFHAP